MAKALAALSLATAIVAHGTPVGSAQEKPPTIRARADLVQVDVVVIDASGAPIPGLTAADFVLRDRGKPQEIASFDEMRHDRTDAPLALPPSVRRDVSSNQTSQSGRLVVLVLDDLHIWKDR